MDCVKLWNKNKEGKLRTSVLRFPLLSPATDTDTDREKYFPGDALLGLLDTGTWEPDKLRSRASLWVLVGMDEGLRVVCILWKPGKQMREASAGTPAGKRSQQFPHHFIITSSKNIKNQRAWYSWRM